MGPNNCYIIKIALVKCTMAPVFSYKFLLLGSLRETMKQSNRVNDLLVEIMVYG